MLTKNSTDLNWLDNLLSFCINKKGFIEFDDDVDPLFIIYAVKNKTIKNDFLIVSEIEKCPKCGSKLYRDGKDKFENQIRIIKQPHFEEGTKLYKEWEKCMLNIEKSYVKMSEAGAKPDQLRMLLSLSTIGEINMTCNIREWRYILRLIWL